MDCNFTVISRNHFLCFYILCGYTAIVPLFYCLNALEDACLPRLPRLPSMLLIHASRFPSMLLRMPASTLLAFNALEDALLPAFKSLDAYYLPPPFHSDSETHQTSTCCKSHSLLIRFYFIHFDFQTIITMRRNCLLVSHVCLCLNNCSPMYIYAKNTINIYSCTLYTPINDLLCYALNPFHIFKSPSIYIFRFYIASCAYTSTTIYTPIDDYVSCIRPGGLTNI